MPTCGNSSSRRLAVNGGNEMSGDQFAPIDKPYLSQWRDRLSDPKPAKPAKVKHKKGKKKAVRK